MRNRSAYQYVYSPPIACTCIIHHDCSNQMNGGWYVRGEQQARPRSHDVLVRSGPIVSAGKSSAAAMSDSLVPSPLVRYDEVPDAKLAPF